MKRRVVELVGRYYRKTELVALLKLAEASGHFDFVAAGLWSDGNLYWLNPDTLPAEAQTAQDKHGLPFTLKAEASWLRTTAASSASSSSEEEEQDADEEEEDEEEAEKEEQPEKEDEQPRRFRYSWEARSQLKAKTVCGIRIEAASWRPLEYQGRCVGVLVGCRTSGKFEYRKRAETTMAVLAQNVHGMFERTDATMRTLEKKEIELTTFLANNVKNKIFEMVDSAIRCDAHATSSEQASAKAAEYRRRSRGSSSSDTPDDGVLSFLVEQAIAGDSQAAESWKALSREVKVLLAAADRAKHMIAAEVSIRELIWNQYSPDVQSATIKDVPVDIPALVIERTGSLDQGFRIDPNLANHIFVSLVENAQDHGVAPLQVAVALHQADSGVGPYPASVNDSSENSTSSSPKVVSQQQQRPSFNQQQKKSFWEQSNTPETYDDDDENDDENDDPDFQTKKKRRALVSSAEFDFRKRVFGNAVLSMRVSNGLPESSKLLKFAKEHPLSRFFARAVHLDARRASENGRGVWLALKCARDLGGRFRCRIEKTPSTDDPGKQYVFVAEVDIPVDTVGEPPQLPADIRIAVLEDSPFLRHTYVKLFQKAFSEKDSSLSSKKNKEQQAICVVRGATYQEARDFARFVMDADPPFDIVLLDNYLDYPESRNVSFSGTDVAKALREARTTATLFMRSANNSAADVASYLKAGVHGVIPKSIAQSSLLKELRHQMCLLKGLDWCKDRPATSSEGSTSLPPDAGSSSGSSGSGDPVATAAEIAHVQANLQRHLVAFGKLHLPCSYDDVAAKLADIKGLFLQCPHDVAIDVAFDESLRYSTDVQRFPFFTTQDRTLLESLVRAFTVETDLLRQRLLRSAPLVGLGPPGGGGATPGGADIDDDLLLPASQGSTG